MDKLETTSAPGQPDARIVGHILDGLMEASEAFKLITPVAMEMHVSPVDHQLVMDLAVRSDDHKALIAGLTIVADARLERAHFVTVMSDESVDIFGESAKAVGLEILARRWTLRMGRLKL